jgi:uncharacterized protein with HEPN domain
MNKIPLPYLEDIENSIKRIEEYIDGLGGTKEAFLGNYQAQDAIIRRLEIIGEATRRLESDFKEKYNQIPWRQISGLRDVLIHKYDKVDLDQIWKIIENELPELKKKVKEILDRGK